MREYIEIGPSPAEEECVQIGDPNYSKLARAECHRFIDAIRQKLGPEVDGAALRVKSSPHDFGTYMEVVCYYDDDDPISTEYAFDCESNAPQRWPESSAKENG